MLSPCRARSDQRLHERFAIRFDRHEPSSLLGKHSLAMRAVLIGTSASRGC